MTVTFLDSEAIGKRIRTLREADGASGADFARRIGVDFRTLYRLERGLNTPSAGVLASIARECGVTTDWLLTGEGDGPEGHVPTLTEETTAREAC